MPADALMSTLEEAKPVHARWSEVNRQFLEFVAANPECMDRGSYTVISQAPGLQTYSSVQPWPLFFGPPQRRELARSEEHTSELQSRLHLVCRLLLEKKKNEPSILPHLPGGANQRPQLASLSLTIPNIDFNLVSP